MPVHYAIGLAGTNNDLGTIPAPAANKKVTMIDWINIVATGASAAFTYLVSVTATGGVGGIPTNQRIDLGTVAGVASSTPSYNTEFPGGLLVCGIGSTVLVRSANQNAAGTICSVQIGYHYE